MSNNNRFSTLACLIFLATQAHADEWWYSEHFPFIYSSSQEWCLIDETDESPWLYSFDDATWYSSENYTFAESEWWQVDSYPYIYSTTRGWIYCYTSSSTLLTLHINSQAFQDFDGTFIATDQSVSARDWEILTAAYGQDLSISLLDAFDISGAIPDFTVSLSSSIPGIEQDGNLLTGSPETSGVVDLTVTATLEDNSSVSQTTQLVVSADDSELPSPNLPSTLIDYEAIIANLPDQYTSRVDDFGNIASTDNTPNNNPITNAGATLGRVLFYDKRLSANNSTSCASCHKQEVGFSDDRQFSLGFEGGETGRHSTALSHARYYEREAFFWDERADTLEDQVLMPIQDSVEMGMTLDNLREKLAATDFYGDLFTNAFGDSEITDTRISQALAQFVRAMVSTESKFDQAFVDGELDTSAFTDEELEGLQLFSGNAGTDGRDLGCIRCHETIGFVGDNTHNIGLDLTDTDEGAGNGEFKVQSLRNIAVTAPYMHDGRFATLEEVIDHYDSGVQDNPNLSNRLRRNNNDTVRRLNLSDTEKASLVAFLETLTDEAFLDDERFSDPFEN